MYDLLDLVSRCAVRHPEVLEGRPADPLILANEAEQYVLGADEAVVHEARLFLRQSEYRPGPISEAFEHFTHDTERSGLPKTWGASSQRIGWSTVDRAEAMRSSAPRGGMDVGQPSQDFFSSSQSDEVPLAGVESEGRIRYPIGEHPTPSFRHQRVSGTLIDVDRRRQIFGIESPWSYDGQILVHDPAAICRPLTQDGGEPATQFTDRLGFGMDLAV